jgi:hypothetical protein
MCAQWLLRRTNLHFVELLKQTAKAHVDRALRFGVCGISVSDVARLRITRGKSGVTEALPKELKIMPTMFQANPKVDQLRATLGHPIVDADAHQIEMVPLFLDFLREAGGAKMPQRWGDYMALTRRAFRMTPEERSQARPGIPVWWPLPAENTLDRATSSLPKLMYARMDEIGLDFAIVYPSLV